VIAAHVDFDESIRAFGRQDAEGATKIAEDLARYRHVLDQTAPQLIVECGTLAGGSALWFARLGYDVVTIDINLTNMSEEAIEHPRITPVRGDSVLVAGAVAERLGGLRTMVVLDSDHSAHHVFGEIQAYAPLVSPGCYLVVEDGICDWIGMAPGPLAAIEATLATWEGWERDAEVEAMFPASMFPAGWWRKEG
jgi:cephalosporin hydroxylase